MNAKLENALKYRFLLNELISRDLKVKYRRSVLGILWSVLNPLLMMIVITTVFQHVFRFDIENFPLYYLTGSLIFNFVSEATNGAMTSVLDNAALIKKVYIPKYIFPLEKCLFSFVNMLFSMIAVLLIVVLYRFKLSWTFLLFPIPMLYVLLFAIGISFILAALYVYFRDLKHLWGVWLTAWMYLTPIIYPISVLENSKALHVIVHLNPLYYYVECFRDVTLNGRIPSIHLNLICLLGGIAVLAFGTFVFKKAQDKFILHI